MELRQIRTPPCKADPLLSRVVPVERLPVYLTHHQRLWFVVYSSGDTREDGGIHRILLRQGKTELPLKIKGCLNGSLCCVSLVVGVG